MSVQFSGNNLIGNAQQLEQSINLTSAGSAQAQILTDASQASATAYAERVGINPYLISAYRQLMLERSASSASSAAPVSNPTTYTVQPGDSLSAIAARYGTTVEELLRLNPDITNADLILVNQKLNLPSSGASSASSSAPANNYGAETSGAAPYSANGLVEPVVGNPIQASASEIAADPALQQQLAAQFAPIFVFHPNETHLPADPDNYYNNGAVNINEADYAGSANPADVTAHYQFNEGPPPTMTYWMFTPYNNAPGGDNFVANKFDHEGDWEAVTIEFDPVTMQPVNMRYSSHRTSETLTWDAVPKVQDAQGNWRPRVYVALGSHAMSPDTGARPTDVELVNDHFAEGSYVIDSANNLENIPGNPWFDQNIRWGDGDGAPTGPSKDKKNQITDDRNSTPGAASRADALIMYYTEYAPDGTLISINWEALAADAADESGAVTEAILQWAKNLNWSGKDDERDEFAQELVDYLWADDPNKYPDDEDYTEEEVRQTALYRFAGSKGGIEALLAMARALAMGEDDEIEDFMKIKMVLAQYGITLMSNGDAIDENGNPL